MYRFTVQYCPGKWHRGPDAVSRNVPAAVKAIYEVCMVDSSGLDDTTSDEVETFVRAVALEAILDYGDDAGAISPDMVRAAGRGDAAYTLLASQVEQGFPGSRHLTDPSIRAFWEVRHRLAVDRGLILLDRRIVIPTSLQKRVLRCLHSAHQGVVGMKARANETVYWPGMDASIRNHRASCVACTKVAPSLPREPILLSPSPEWPFQQIVMDLFYVGHHTYLACADRFTGWLMLYHLKPGQAGASSLISVCRGIFEAYGVPDQVSSDGGPPFTSEGFQNFLKAWNVTHRLSSVAYAQSNGRAELAVKAAKRIVCGNTSPDGSLNNDSAARAVLQYRNTPIQEIGLSPAQMLLHRRLRDNLPAQPCLYKPHPEWVMAAQQREQLLRRRDARLVEAYNRSAHSLPQLAVGDVVVIQDPKTRRWTRTGRIAEILGHRQHKIRVDGSGRVTLRNRRFLRKVDTPVRASLIPGACAPTPAGPAQLNPEAPTFVPIPTPPQVSPQALPAIQAQPQVSPQAPPAKQIQPQVSPEATPPPRMSRALARLLPHNKVGLKEINPSTRPAQAGRGGEM